MTVESGVLRRGPGHTDERMRPHMGPDFLRKWSEQLDLSLDVGTSLNTAKEKRTGTPAALTEAPEMSFMRFNGKSTVISTYSYLTTDMLPELRDRGAASIIWSCFFLFSQFCTSWRAAVSIRSHIRAIVLRRLPSSPPPTWHSVMSCTFLWHSIIC